MYRKPGMLAATQLRQRVAHVSRQSSLSSEEIAFTRAHSSRLSPTAPLHDETILISSHRCDRVLSGPVSVLMMLRHKPKAPKSKIEYQIGPD